MEYRANLLIESKQIGEVPQTAAAPRPSGQIVFARFEVPSKQPLPGGVSIGDFMQELESDVEMKPHLEQARRDLADVVDKPGTLRNLRLAAGMSQATLAELAVTTQSYIARVEAGTVDPGTDMLVRLAGALGVREVEAFAAVRAQRSDKGAE